MCNGPARRRRCGCSTRRRSATIASLTLPPRPNGDRTDLAGGDPLRRARRRLAAGARPTTARCSRSPSDGGGLRQTGARSPRGCSAASERPFAVGAGFDGRDWVVGTNGTVIAIPRDGGAAARAARCDEPVTEDIATDPTGTYVVTRAALYRLQGRRRRQRRGSSGADRRCAVGLGHAAGDRRRRATSPSPTGSTRRGSSSCARRAARPGASPAPCRSSGPGQGGSPSHLVVAGRSIVATNTHGYDNLAPTEVGRTTIGGIARVVVGRVAAAPPGPARSISPSAQPVVSRATGLLYTLAKPAGFPDAWNLAAVDWRTGELRFQALAGEGLGHNSEGGALVLAPDGTAFAGTFGGVVRFRDS